MIVVDASVVVPALLEESGAGDQAARRLSVEDVAAPQILYLETPQVIRKNWLRGEHNDDRAVRLFDALLDMPIRAFDHLPLLPRIWALRHNINAYDAAYVALAEVLDVTLVTADERLARAPGTRCRIEVLRD